MDKVDRKALLSGDITIDLKEPKWFLNDKWEVCVVERFKTLHVAIIESEGICYAAMPLDERALTGILYETRDTFDELVAQYPQKTTNGL